MVGAKGAVVATLAIGGGALGLYALGVNQGWWKLPAWLGGPSPAEVAAQRAREAARQSALDESRPNPRFGTRVRNQGYVGSNLGPSNAGRGGARYAYIPNTPLRADAATLTDSYGAGLTQQANQTVLRRIFTSS